MRNSYVYILTNKINSVFYTGVTDDLIRRVWEHRNHIDSVFTTKYLVNKLVWFEVYEDINEAIYREKLIKGGSRQKKIDLITKNNPEFNDLYYEIASS